MEAVTVVSELKGYLSTGVYIPLDLCKRAHGLEESLVEAGEYTAVPGRWVLDWYNRKLWTKPAGHPKRKAAAELLLAVPPGPEGQE